MQKIENSIQDYLSDGSNASYSQIKRRFGEPKQIAAAYVSEVEAEELLRDLRIRKQFLRIVTVTAAIALFLWIGVVTLAYVRFLNQADGSMVEEIEIIESYVPESGEIG